MKFRFVNSLFLGKYYPLYLPKVDMDLYGEKGYYGKDIKYKPALVGFKDYGDGFIPNVIKEYKDWPLSEVQMQAKNYMKEYRFVFAMNIANPNYQNQVKLLKEFLDSNYRIQ